MPTTTTVWSELSDVVDGDVVLPESPDYDRVRKPAIARYHAVRPLAVVRCRRPEDVAAALRSPVMLVCQSPSAAAGTASPAARRAMASSSTSPR